jgi:hypothetical protein
MLSVTRLTFAQGVQTGTIRGVATSSDGQALPGVAITVRSAFLQGPRSTTTELDGRYTVGLLPAGTYDVSFELSGMATIERRVELPLGGVAPLNATMAIAPVTATVTVTAPVLHATPVAGLNITHNQVEALAISRGISGIAELSPALTTIVPNPGQNQVSISGGFAFDNVFLLNGVDINDNLFGGPQDLFIEDAVQEVQTLTSGIGAEYGRFSGGVVNAISKSGGNLFSGGLRINFTNPTWSTRTPFEAANQSTHPDILNKSYEGTVGGPMVKDRLWFFAAGRSETLAQAQTFPLTGLSNTETDKNRRAEIKITGSPTIGHTLQGGYVNNQTDNESRPSIPGLSIDRFTITPAEQPNWFSFAKYQGALTPRVLAEAQYSQREWSRVGGGTASAIVDSPFFDSNQTSQYNAPYFDASDPERRSNKQVTASLTSFLEGGGRHELKGGYEWFRSQWAGGNTQSSTGYIFFSDFATNAAGNPLYDASGHLIPLFSRGATVLDRSIADRGSVLNVDTQSLYVQDHWTADAHWSFDLGARYEHVKTGTSSIAGVRANTVVPRLAAAYDVNGDGRWVARASYAHYAGRYDENQIGKNTLQGNTNDIVGIYVGPTGQGRDFAPGFNTANYVTVAGSFPTANVSLASDLSTPITREFTLSLGSDAGGRGSAEARYVFRRTSNLIEDFVTLSNGITSVVQNGVDAGTFTNVVYKNSDVATREYQALLFQASYRLHERWSVNGHYTAMLKDEGNYEGESRGIPGDTTLIGNYPEAFNATRNFPAGRLQSFQRHKLRVWTVYDLGLGRAGTLGLSGLWRVNSGRVYSLSAGGQRLTATQQALLSAYPDQPASQVVFFGARGSEDFPGYGLLDTSINYDVPVFRTLRPWIKLDVFNLFDNLKQTGWNTTIQPDAASPKDALGLATGYIKSPLFGTATNNNQFPAPLAGVVGGRTLRVAVGFRF